MQEQKRTKILAGLLVGTVAFYGIRPDEKIFEPLRDVDNRHIRAIEDLQTAESNERDLLQSRFKLNQWRRQSLPPDGENALRVYREWINDLAEECGLGGPDLVVTPKGRQKAAGSTRDGLVFEGIQVQVETEATLTDLTRFLYRFERVGLLQRITTLNIESTDTEGDPYMGIVLVAEGISMKSAEDRPDLFTESQLSVELDEDATTLAVDNAEAFPTSPGFQIKVGSEYMLVTAISESGEWTVKRGIDDTTPETHSAQDRVQHIPIAEKMAGASFEDYQEFLAASPFVKPVEPVVYAPKINTILKKELIRGNELSMTVTTSGFDKSLGEPVFALGDGHPEGMAIDKESGKLTWAPGDDVELKDYEAQVLVTQTDNPEVKLQKDFTVTVKVQNNDPSLTVPRGDIAVWLGRTVTVELKIDDETPAEDLKFEITGAEGAFVDSRTQAFTWRPAEDMEPGEYDVKITVTDAGGKTADGNLKFIARDDAARYTRFTGSVGLNDDMEAMLTDQINNKRTTVKVGGQLTVADISGSIKAIGARSLVLTTLAGDMEIGLGEDLRTVAEKFEEEQKRNPPPKSDGTPDENTTTPEKVDEKEEEVPAASEEGGDK